MTYVPTNATSIPVNVQTLSYVANGSSGEAGQKSHAGRPRMLFEKTH
jgi:hypothetical protein